MELLLEKMARNILGVRPSVQRLCQIRQHLAGVLARARSPVSVHPNLLLSKSTRLSVWFSILPETSTLTSISNHATYLIGNRR